jgi:predicted Zn-dependent peptidase
VGSKSFPSNSTVSTLSNRLRVVTEPNAGHFHAVGVYIDAGSRYETGRNSGVSHLIDRLAFKVCATIRTQKDTVWFVKIATLDISTRPFERH